MRATIKDVARDAGVAISTVSRVLNNSGPVSESTRKRIMDSVERLGFVPNKSASNLVTQKTHMIGVILPDLYGEFYSEVIRSLDQTAQTYGYNVILSSSQNNQAEVEAALKPMQGSVDGLIVMYPNVNALLDKNSFPVDIPLVLLHNRASDDRFYSITVDNFGGAHAMVNHLIQVGHQRIAIIKGEDSNIDAIERLRGYNEAIKAAGLDYRTVFGGDFTQNSGYEAARQILSSSPMPTAVFASNDAMAIGAMSAFREAGLSIPEDIAIAGFDDIPIAKYLSPPLTTIRFSIKKMGELAVQNLIGAMAPLGQEAAKQELLPAELVVRQSCGSTITTK